MAFFMRRRHQEKENGTEPRESATGSIFSFLLELLRAIMAFFSSRNDRLNELDALIKEKEEALRLAIQEGRITDSSILKKELDALRAQRGLSAAAAAGHMAVVLFLAVACSGCFTRRPSTVVIGERINIVKPGDEIVVRDHIPPAKTWYLVDDVGLSSWLGISALTKEDE